MDESSIDLVRALGPPVTETNSFPVKQPPPPQSASTDADELQIGGPSSASVDPTRAESRIVNRPDLLRQRSQPCPPAHGSGLTG